MTNSAMNDGQKVSPILLIVVSCNFLDNFYDAALGRHQEVVKQNISNAVIKMPMERSELKNNLESMEKKEDSLGVNICHVKICCWKSQVQPKMNWHLWSNLTERRGRFVLGDDSK